MSTSTQLTTHSRKGFKNRFPYLLTRPGSLSLDAVLVTRTYREAKGNAPVDIVYDGVPWELRSTRSTSRSERLAFCQKSRKNGSRVDKMGFRPPNSYSATFMQFWSYPDNQLYLRTGPTSLQIISGGFQDITQLSWNTDEWITGTGSLTPQYNKRHRAEVECLLKLKDMKVNFGEALAEARSTVSHLARTATTLLRAYSYARRGKWTKLLKELKVNPKRKWSTKDPASRWLEVQFGWTPLVNDIKGVYDLSQSQLRSNGLFFSAERNLVSSYLSEDINRSNSQQHSETSCLFTGTRGVAVKLYARVRDEDIANLTSLGLSDPLQVAWALVPFSFVVDWVLPVGSYLEALGATKGLTFVSGTCTEFINGSLNISAGYKTLSAESDGMFSKWGSVSSVRRTVYQNFPAPIPYIKSPFSISHLTSALALFRTIAFKR